MPEEINNNADNDFSDKEILLKVDNLSQYFGDLKAVNHVSFEIHKGEVFGLVGESGCGKTTTGRTIIKLYNATGGNVFFKGRRIVAGTLEYKKQIEEYRKKRKSVKEDFNRRIKEEKYPEKKKILISERNKETEKYDFLIEEQKREIKKATHDQKHCDKDYEKEHVRKVKEKYSLLLKKAQTEEEKKKTEKEYRKEEYLAGRERLVTQIQMIFQDSIASLDPRMTVREIISEGLTIQGIKERKYIDGKVYEVLERVGLVREHAGRYPHEFSGGQRQRIGIARALVMKPELIIADEPISALDVSIQAQVINLMNEIRKDLGLTILFIAHDLSVVKYFSDKIGVMYFGKIVELASSKELFSHPMHPYTKALFSDIPRPDPHFEKKRKRITYNQLKDHDYSENKPTFREVVSGHFVLCNDEECEKYRKEYRINE